jgi:Membrane-associated lipoprotein involved in thiamine biosynthesis
MKGSTSISRRRFLQTACTAGAALAVAGLAGPLPLTAFALPASLHKEQQSRLLMGTIVTLTAATAERARAHDAFTAAFAEMERLVAVFDRHSSTSALGVLNSQGTLAAPPAELHSVLSRALRLGQASEYAFNPAIAPVVDLFDRSAGALPTHKDADFQEALGLAAPGGVQLAQHSISLERQGMRLTLDGIAKGFIADKASETLARHGLTDHMVNAGGDIRCSGRPAPGKLWAVGIQHPGPARPGGLLGTARMGNGGIATSGSYESWYDRPRGRHHLISHLTGQSADIASVTVRAANTMEADALATALAFMPPALALRFAAANKASCLIADRHGRVWTSSDWI